MFSLYQPECLPSECGHAGHSLNFSYDLAGNLASLKYPDGRVVKNTFNPAARFSTSTFDNWNGQAVGYQYLSVPSHTPTGAWATANYGNGMTESDQYNSRLQPSVLAVSSVAQTWMSRTYNWYTASGQDNGNLMVVHDNLNSNRDQYFGYDWLNRIGNANSNAPTGSPDAWGESYSIDPWGNARQSGSLSFTPNAFDANNRISQTLYNYDAAGNLYADSFHTYAFDAEERVRSVDSTGATYTFDGVGDRVRKDVSGRDSTEYVYVNNQVTAEYDPTTADWSDYIYADGRRVAKADSFEMRLHIFGTTPAGAGWQYEGYNFSAYNGYVVQTGDKLYVRQFQSPSACGGVDISFTDGSRLGFTLSDSDGYLSNEDGVHGTWHYRHFDLNSYAGKTISTPVVLMEGCTQPGGPWDIYFADFVLVSADGTAHPLYTRQPSISLSMWGSSGVVSPGYESQNWGSFWPEGSTTYYHQDQVGSARLITGYGGWPVWSGTFLPFGQEWNPEITTNHYKFTGDERDMEGGSSGDGLDHTMFRQYEAAQGRWLSPDPAGLAVADLTNPQSLNLYAYVNNNPLRFIDPLGLDCVYFNDMGDGVESVDQSPDAYADCGDNGGTWVNGTVDLSSISYDPGTDTFNIGSIDQSTGVNYNSTVAANGTWYDPNQGQMVNVQNGVLSQSAFDWQIQSRALAGC